MADERNFRSTYYEKVGCRGVEERKSLEILLKEKPLNLTKLTQFCIRFTVPKIHRNSLWNSLLGVTPVYDKSREYVMEQRVAVYKDLRKALRTMRIVDEDAPTERVFYAMWLMEKRQLYLGRDITQESHFCNITKVLLKIFDNHIETYWIAKSLYDYSEEVAMEMGKLSDLTYTTLDKEDSTLYKHLKSCDMLTTLPLADWYKSFFAGVLSETALIRVWDRICGGAIKIVVYVMIETLRILRWRILRCTELGALLKLIESIKKEQDTADVIVNAAIELWQQNKGHEFVPHSKVKSVS